MFAPSTSEKQPGLDVHAAEQAALQQGENLALNKLDQKVDSRIQNIAATTQQVIGVSPPIMSTPPFAPTESFAPGESFTPIDTRGTSQDDGDAVGYTCADISIGNYKVRSFESFQLMQSTRTHHMFELVVAHNALLDGGGKSVVEDEWLSATGQLLGEPIRVNFYYHIWPDKQRKFNGVITKIGYRQSSHGFGDIVITGGSPTLLLDGAPHIQSFTAKNLKDVAKEVFRQGGLKVDENNIQPSYTSQLPYTCQYNETHYNYLARLAAHYGECFFYDGENIRFGKPVAKPDVNLVLGRDVSNIYAAMKGSHVQPVHYGYNSEKHGRLAPHTFEVKGLEEMGNVALEASKKMYKTTAKQISPIRATLDEDITATQKSLAAATAAELFTVEGTTANPYLFPGCHVVLEFRNVSTNEKMHYAELTITDLKQTLQYDGLYSCEFTGVSFKSEYLPHPHFEMAKAEAQIAEVKDNNDKGYNLGRVRVKFPWQDEPTDFIRVMTPDAGSSDKVKKNRGLVAIPEISDQVMVGFVQGHPDRPYVMGSMFHGENTTGGDVGNNVKSLTDKYGSNLILNNGTITLKDKHGIDSKIFLDGQGNIVIQSNKKIIMQSSDIEIKASNNIALNAANDICLGATNVIIATTVDEKGGGGIIKANAQKNMVLKSDEDSVNITALAKDVFVEAPAGKLSAEAATQIKITSPDTQIF